MRGNNLGKYYRDHVEYDEKKRRKGKPIYWCRTVQLRSRARPIIFNLIFLTDTNIENIRQIQTDILVSVFTDYIDNANNRSSPTQVTAWASGCSCILPWFWEHLAKVSSTASNRYSAVTYSVIGLICRSVYSYVQFLLFCNCTQNPPPNFLFVGLLTGSVYSA